MTVDELQVLVTANTNELRKEIGKANKSISGLKKSADKGTAGVANAFKKLKQGIIALGIGKIIKDSIMSGMEAIESDSFFDTALGKYAEDTRSWSEKMSNALGLNAVEVRKNTATIFTMTSSMGIAEENALKMSKGISLLSNDLASFRDLSSEEAFNKIKAGITGEAEPLKALGILVDENTVKQVAYSEGIAQNGAELTQQQKVLARYVAILKQTGNAQGDLARTIDSPSNQLRMLKNNLTQAGIALSNFFMPAVKMILPWLNALAKVTTQALNSLASFFGLTGGEDTAEDTKKISDNVGGISSGFDDATKSAKKMKGALAGFDEMNVLSDNSSDSAGATSSAGASIPLDFDLTEYDAHLDWIEGDTNALADRIKTKFTEVFGSIDFTNFFTALGELKEAIAPLVENVGTGLGWFVNNVLVPIAEWTIEDVIPAFLNLLGGAIQFVNQVIDDIKPIFSWFWDNVLSPIAGWTGGIMVDILTAIGDALKWIADNEIAMAVLEGMAIAIGLVTVALKAYNIVKAIFTNITTIATAVGTAFGAVMSFITSPITLVTLAIGAVIAVVILLVKNWETVKEVASKCWEGIKSVWNTVAEWFNKYIVQPIANFFSGLWNGLKTGAQTVWNGIKKVFSGIGSFFSGIWDGIKNIFSKAGKFISDTIGGAFKGAINAVLGTAVSIINGFISAINFAIGIINKIPGVEITKLSKLEVPKFARGGVIDKPTVGMIGEAGKEVVMPLERNTGWIEQLANKLADKIGGGGGNIKLIVKLGEDTIFDKFIEYTKEKSFETNGEVVFA